MGALSRWSVMHPKSAIGAWVLFVALLIFGGNQFGGAYNDSFSLPNTESKQAQDVLQSIPGAGEQLNANTGRVVWSAESGKAVEGATAATVTASLTKIAAIPSVGCVVSPLGQPLGTDCPKPQPGQGGQAGQGGEGGQTPDVSKLPLETQKALASLSPAPVSPDGKVAIATITFKGAAEDLKADDAKAVLDEVKALNATPGVIAGVDGQALEFAGQEPPSSEGIGIMVALIILLFTFGSLVGAFLPIFSAVIALVAGFSVVQLTARFLDVATFAPTLAAMIGLGVGIDYSLFVINRYRQALQAGKEPREAALESVRTSGRAVVFAAMTVVIALFGLFVTGVNFFYGLAIASAATVVLMALGATFFLPAMLSLLGTWSFAGRMVWINDADALARQKLSGAAHQVGRVLRYVGWVLVLPVTLMGLVFKAIRGNRAEGTVVDHAHGGAFGHYGAWLEKNYRWFGALAAALLLLLASPVLSLRLGFADASGNPAGSPSRVAYDLISEGFGPGVNGPFIVAVQTENNGDNAAVAKVAGAIQKNPGVALAQPFPMAKDFNATAIQVIPTTGPQDAATADLLVSMREDSIPAATAGTTTRAYVGGTQAITSDFTDVLTKALPLLLLVVIGLGFLTLVLLFRSILVPLTGAVTSLLSLAAAMGVTVAVFQWGWLANVFGLSGTGPIAPFLPIMVFAILFGLSMDYQVFLVSRMQEEWAHRADNRRAVRAGIAGSGRVVVIAAAIMFSVFAAFIPTTNSTIKLFGVALSTAVLFDAFIVRMIVVPSVMFALGDRNWWLPGWLDRVLPNVKVEDEGDYHAIEDDLGDLDDLGDPKNVGVSV